MKHQRNLRYDGERWMIIHGSMDGVERFALVELQRAVQTYLPYVVEVWKEADPALLSRHHMLLSGTISSNPIIAQLAAEGRITIPRQREGYGMICQPSPWNKKRKLVVLAGHDASGALYAVEDFNARVLAAQVMPEIPGKRRAALDGLAEFAIQEHPQIQNRGIWSWGYVIYDYRRFFDNMARLRMNMVTIWNDCPPINCREVIDYAHSRGIQVILGFPWGWGYKMDISREKDRRTIKDMVLREFTKNYENLSLDGIYLQTDTEHATTTRRGRSTAAWTCELVNDIVRNLLTIQPKLGIQFGLHATSIQQNYTDLETLDPRVTITWEDAGVIPYAYEPIISWDQNETIPLDQKVASWRKKEVGTPERTTVYSKKLAALRENSEFALVPKGWIILRWREEFEHHGPFLLGERDRTFIRNRLQERQPRWDRMNSLWRERYPLAAKFYREILKCRPSRMTVTGLVEDGLFEERIQPSVALFAHTIWNPHRHDQDILQLAMSPYYHGNT